MTAASATDAWTSTWRTGSRLRQRLLDGLHERRIEPADQRGARGDAALGVEQDQLAGVVELAIGQLPVLQAEHAGQLPHLRRLGAGQRPDAPVQLALLRIALQRGHVVL